MSSTASSHDEARVELMRRTASPPELIDVPALRQALEAAEAAGVSKLLVSAAKSHMRDAQKVQQQSTVAGSSGGAEPSAAQATDDAVDKRLADAITRVRLTDSTLTARAVRSALVQEAEWCELSLADVKRTSSKMVKLAAQASSTPSTSASLPPSQVQERSSTVLGISGGDVMMPGAPAALREAPVQAPPCCANCGKAEGDGVTLKICERCKEDGLTPLMSCSVSCFEAQWPEHKKQHKRHRMCCRVADALGSHRPSPPEYRKRLERAEDGENGYESLVAKARRYEGERKLKKAEKALRQSLVLEPGNPVGYFSLARVMGAQGDLRSMVAMYADCVRCSDPTSLIFASALALHFVSFSAARKPPAGCDGPDAPTFEDCEVVAGLGDLGAPPVWWNLPALMTLSALAIDTVERHDQGAIPEVSGYNSAPIWHMRAQILASAPRMTTFTLAEKVARSPKEYRQAARCFRAYARVEATSPVSAVDAGASQRQAIERARNCERAAADPRCKQIYDATKHFAEHPESDEVFYLNAASDEEGERETK